MSIRLISVVLVIGVLGLGFAAWWTQREKPRSEMPAGPDASMPAPAPESASPGLRWKVPAPWQTQPDRAMRVATYSTPPATGDREAGECAVFYFGPGQGGETEANIERWIGQFDRPQVGKRSSREVHGVRVTHVEIRGTYLAPSGPAMESQGSFENFALIGAIAEGPNGSVFFKFTGPAKTVEKARGEFEDMINSIQKE